MHRRPNAAGDSPRAHGRAAGGLNRLAMPRTDVVVRSFRRLVPAYVTSRAGAWWIHRVVPFPVADDAARLMVRLEHVVRSLPRSEVKTATDEYLHAVCRTLLGFRDDLEFRFSPAEGVVHVQSVSRVGLFDFGVNRRRVERVRRGLGVLSARGATLGQARG